MTLFRSEETLAGLIGLVVLPLIGLRIWRGVRTGVLPIYRTYLKREDDRTKFAVLLFLHVPSFVLVAVITADLLVGSVG